MTPSSTTERVHLFLAEYRAEDRIGAGGGAADEIETIDAREEPLDALWAEAVCGRVGDAKFFMLLQALLGYQPDAPNGQLFLDPDLPDWMGEITLRDIPVGDMRFDLRLGREAEETWFEVTKGDASRVRILLDGKPLEFTWSLGARAASGNVSDIRFTWNNLSVGHRFMDPEPFPVTGVADYRRALKEAYVILDPDERKAKIKSDAEALAKALGLVLRDTQATAEALFPAP